MNKIRTFLVFVVFVITKVNTQIVYRTLHSRPVYKEKFCKDNIDIEANFDPDIGQGYRVFIRKKLTAATEVRLKLDSEGTISFGSPDFPGKTYNAKFIADIDLINNIFSFLVLEDYEEFLITVQGKRYPHHPPYILSLIINGEENCREPDRTYFEGYFPDMIHFWSAAPDKFCGRRKIYKEPVQLIVRGSATKAGNWPWHAAIYKLQSGVLDYICGGTLISKALVLTAAHCATVRGVPVNPEILGVTLGKYRLVGTEITTQDKEVHQVIVHEDFDQRTLNNDIALLKLKIEAIFNNYVQPACIWFDGVYDKLESYEINGTIVGWGIDQSENLAKKLRETTMPIVPDITCIRYEPIFYNNMLNGKKFCAGHSNGTAACNGDSGGGMLVFIEDDTNNPYNTDQGVAGAWYLRGIVSVTLVQKDSDFCNPEAYTIFTDVAKYIDWILKHMNKTVN